ncbi:MAG TPA: hypothetical protein VNU46_01570 [Gemmatimonadaceae bacterium]|jgi:hypothetical protein|nr:hypothetical protein [Gemmatimonadaceae bacterium]
MAEQPTTPPASPTPPAASPPSAAATATPVSPPNGTQAVLAAGMAIMGVVTALFPCTRVTSVVLNVLPQLRVAVPIVLTSVGSIWAAVSHPPTFPTTKDR